MRPEIDVELELRNAERRAALAHTIDGLPDGEMERLVRVLTEPLACVEDPSFKLPETERQLFGEEIASMRRTRPWSNGSTQSAKEGETSRTVTLSGAQERRLFLRLNYARWRTQALLAGIRNRLSRQTATQLLVWSGRAEEARITIVRANMPLVLAMTKRTRLGNIDFAELISEGNMALLRSVDKFDCARGFKFSTYSCRAIIKSFSRVAMRASRYRGRFPTEFDPLLERSDFLERNRIREESDCVDELRGIMKRNLAALNDVEQTVIRARFALDAPVAADQPPAPKTLEEVGLLIGVTKERVRQIQNRALAKLRAALEDGILAA